MGRFIVDIMHHDGNPVDVRKRRNPNPILSKSIDGTSKQVINQDSVLIKHDFDAGQSKLAKNHQMT